MRILIDGDGCPVVKQTVTVATQFQVDCIIFCDTAHEISLQNSTTITVDQGADSVDFALVNALQEGDIVVTQDYGLAAMCLGRHAKVIHQDGMIYNEENINSLLMARHNEQKIRRSGGRLKGPKKRSGEENDKFIKSLKKLLENPS